MVAGCVCLCRIVGLLWPLQRPGGWGLFWRFGVAELWDTVEGCGAMDGARGMGGG